MASERLNESVHLTGVGSLAPEDLAPLRECVQRAFGLAKAGASSRGYLLLREGRAQVLTTYAPDDARIWELLHHWDAVIRWYERYAPAPLLAPRAD